MASPKIGTLILRNILRSVKSFILCSIGIVVGIAAFVFFVGLGDGLERIVQDRIFPSLPPNQIEVVPRYAMVGKRVTSKMRMRKEDEAELKKIPKVKRTWPRHNGDFPASAEIPKDISIKTFKRQIPPMDIPIDGLSPEAIENEKTFVGNRAKFRFKGDDPRYTIPVILSNQMYGLYITQLAPAMGLPLIPRETIIGVRAYIHFGQSFFRGQAKRGKPVRRLGEVVGFSNLAHRTGITIPAKYIALYNKRYTDAYSQGTYRSIILETDTPEDNVAVAAELKKRGYRQDLNAQTELAVQMVTTEKVVFGAISIVIMIIAALHIMHTFFMLVFERKREIGVLRAVGATQWHIRLMILGEATVVGLVSGITGVAIGLGASSLANTILGKALPNLAYFKGMSFFNFSASLLLGAIGFAVLFSLLGAILPAQRASSMEPAVALSAD